MSEYRRRQRRGLLGARRRWSVDVAEEWLLGGFMALTVICTWVMTPNGGFLVVYSLIFWAIVLFVPYSVFAVLVLLIVEFLED